MKFAIVLAVCFAAAVAFPDEKPFIPVLRHEEVHNDQGYNIEFLTGEGTLVKAHGTRVPTEEGDVLHVTGSYEYTSPEGKLIKVSYVADEHGFKASGDHLPKVTP